MENEKNIENQEVVSAKKKWDDNFAKRHADIDRSDEEAYYGAINADYDDFDSRVKSYEEDNEKIVQMLKKNPAFAQMLVEAHNGGNPWKVLAKIGGEPLIELMKDPENDELANNVLDGMNEYAKSVSDRELLEKEQLENIGPSIEAMLEVADENGMSDEQTNEMYSLWDRIQEGAIKNKVDKDIWQMLAKAVMHDENVSAAETEGEMRGKNAKMHVEKNHIIKGASPSMLRGQGGGPRESGAERRTLSSELGNSIWDRDNENEL